MAVFYSRNVRGKGRMETAKCLIFYSWQSDLPNPTNRGFIMTALEGAAKALRADDSLQVEPVVDRDTNGVPGSPDIAGTIFNKIDQSQVFVCDISIINQGGPGRLTPNPNVLIELGYAMKTLEAKRIILVFNSAYGPIESLPFDLRTRRVIQYSMLKDAEARAPERKRLTHSLTEGLRIILNHLETLPPGEILHPPSLAEQAQTAVLAVRPDQSWHVRQYMKTVVDTIASLTPVFSPQEQEQEYWDEQLMQALEASKEMVYEFTHVAESIARMGSFEAAQAMYKGFEGILNLYTFSPDFQGNRHEFAHDLAKFLGHELFVTFFTTLFQEQRWEISTKLFDETLYARKGDFSYPSAVPFSTLSQSVELLDVKRKHRLRLNRMSPRFDLLAERHTQGIVASSTPMMQFVEADYFLFLRAQLHPEVASEWITWIPWSVPAMRHPPQYIQEAITAKGAQKLLHAFALEDISTLRTRLVERTPICLKLWSGAYWHYGLSGFDFRTIGTK